MWQLSAPISQSSRFWPSERSLARKFSLSTPMRCVTVRLNRRTCATISAVISLTLVRDIDVVSHFRGAVDVGQQAGDETHGVAVADEEAAIVDCRAVESALGAQREAAEHHLDQLQHGAGPD